MHKSIGIIFLSGFLAITFNLSVPPAVKAGTTYAPAWQCVERNNAKYCANGHYQKDEDGNKVCEADLLINGSSEELGCDADCNVVINNDDIHILKLTATNLQTADYYYVVGCAQKENGAYGCTTGNDTYDSVLGLSSKRSDHTFVVKDGAKRNITGGDLTVYVLSHTTEDVNHSFFFVGITETDDTEETNTSQQQATFDLDTAAENCISVRWDPYGRIFDSQSLEPLPNKQIKILDSGKKSVSLVGLENPYTTLADGAFYFLVEPGTYYLEPTVTGNYTFSADPNLNANYTKAYSEIYKPGEAIVEKAGVMEHRDVPLDPGTNTPYRADPISMLYGALLMGTTIKVEGRVSHPLTVVAAYQNQKEILRVTADKYGDYNLFLPTAKLSAGQTVEIYLIKNNLVTGQLATQKKLAYSFIPMLPYIEGNAYDKNGQTAALATVNVKLQSSDSVYYQTTSDKNGYFTISPKNLPIFNYYLEVVPAGLGSTDKVVYSVSGFIEKNKEYLEKNKINLMTMTKNGQPIFTEEKSTAAGRGGSNLPSGFSGSQIGAGKTDSDKSSVSGQSGQSANSLLIIAIILILLIGGAGAMLGLYLYKKKNQTPPPPFTSSL